MKVNVKNIAKKIASLLLLGIGLSFLEAGVHAALLTNYISSTSSVKLNPSAIIFRSNTLGDTLIGIVFITLASFSWDWKKNWKIFGIFLCVSGFNFMFQAFGALSNPPFKDFSPFDKIFPTSIVVGFISSAILFIAIGIFIIKRTQRNRGDRNTLTEA